MSITPKELEIPFSPAGVDKPCITYCKVFGDLGAGTKRPLVVVHGGPGMCHDYLLPLADLAAGGTPVVFYDQLGGGRSTHLPERNGDTAFWTEALFMDEFDNVVRHLGIGAAFDVLGQSWGGMLMARYAATRAPAGLHRLVVANSPISMKLWIEAANELRGQLPQDVQVRAPARAPRRALTRPDRTRSRSTRRRGRPSRPRTRPRCSRSTRSSCAASSRCPPTS